MELAAQALGVFVGLLIYVLSAVATAHALHFVLDTFVHPVAAPASSFFVWSFGGVGLGVVLVAVDQFRKGRG